jgi:hypothetical protein
MVSGRQPGRLLAWRLAWRLLWPRGAAERFAALWLAAAGAVLASCLLLLLGMVLALGLRSSVQFAREPVIAGQVHRPDAPGAIADKVDAGGVQLTRLRLSPWDGVTRLPPGIPAWPGPGQLLASPAAIRLLATNPYAAALAPGHLTGTIGPQALLDPGEAYVVIGRPLRELTGKAFPITGFGSSPSPSDAEFTSGGLVNAAVLALSILGGGALVMLHTVTRLASRARRRRIAVLQLLGAPTSAIRSAAGFTATVLAGTGALAAVLLHPPLTRLVASAGILGIRWWPGPATLPPTARVITAVLVTAAVTATARRTTDTDPWARRRDATERTPAPWRAIPAALGICGLTGVLISQARSANAGMPASGVAVLLASLLTLLTGVPLAASLLIRLTARWAARLPSLTWRLAGARARHHAASTARMTVALTMITLLAGLAIGTWSIAAARFAPSPDGTVGVSVNAVPGTTWAAQLAARTLANPALKHAEVERKWWTAPSGATLGGQDQVLASAAMIRPDDASYTFTLPPADALNLAAGIEREHPGTQHGGMIGEDLTGPYGVLLGTTLCVLALMLSTVMSLLALAVTLTSLHADRTRPDTTLLMIGLSHRRLQAARAAETLLSTIPVTLAAILLSAGLAHAIAHVDDPRLPVTGTLLTGLAAAALIIAILLAAAAALTTTTPGHTPVRRE